MVDDQDRCEWVNVSSGTGSARLSQTKDHKTVVVVVVVLAMLCSNWVTASIHRDIHAERSCESLPRVDGFIPHFFIFSLAVSCLRCFDAVGWAAGRASGL